MPSITQQQIPSAKNSRAQRLGSHGPDQAQAVEESFTGPGFGFVRSFLRLILLLVSAMMVLAGLLSWHFGMDVTVEGQGLIEPRHRYLIKTQIAGIIQQIHVRQGQQLTAGAVLVTLDNTAWRAELQKVEKDLEVNPEEIVPMLVEIR